MTDTADLVKAAQRLDDAYRIWVAGGSSKVNAAKLLDTWPTIKAELSRLSARVDELEILCALRADNNRELVAALDDANNRTVAAEQRAAAMRDALSEVKRQRDWLASEKEQAMRLKEAAEARAAAMREALEKAKVAIATWSPDPTEPLEDITRALQEG